MTDQMPPVAQFSLPTPGQKNQPTQGSQPTQTPSGMPPVATFSLPGMQQSQQGNQDPGFLGNLSKGNYGGAAINALQGAGKGLGSVYNAIASPLVSLGAIPVQALAKATGQPDPYAQGIPSVAQFAGGQPTSVTPLNAEQKIGNAAQVASYLVGGEGVLPAVAAGTLQGAGTAMAQGKNAQDVATEGGIGAATGGVLGLLGKGLSAFGDKTLNSIIKPNAADIKDGFSLDTIKENNLGGSLETIKDKTQSLLSSLSSELRTKLADSTNSIDLAEIFDKVKNDFTSAKGAIENFGQNSGIGRALQRLQDEVLTANPTKALSIPDAQLVKQAAGGMGAWQYGSADPDATAIQTVYNKFYNYLKTSIEENSPEGVKGINQKISDLIPVMNAVIRRIPIAARNGGVSLGDMIGLTGTTMNPLAAIPTAIEMASHSGAIGGVLSRFGGLAGKFAAPATAGVNTGINAIFPNASQGR